MTTEAKIICDSVGPNGVRLTTFVLTFPRFILPEFNTHRMFSRNGASSRAIPVLKQIQKAEQSPFIPQFNENTKGMQGGDLVNKEIQNKAEAVWLKMRDACVQGCKELVELGIAKQYTNRPLEAFGYTTMVVTATEYSNFFALRHHSMAQPEIQKLASSMWHLYSTSKPKELKAGEWHLPFITEEEIESHTQYFNVNGDMLLNTHKNVYWDKLIKMSVARCARVSYLNHDGTQNSYEQDCKLYDRLLKENPKHCFDAKTEVLTDRGFVFWEDVKETDKLACVDKDSGLYIGMHKPIELLSFNYDGNFYHYEGRDISLRVTEGHRLFGHKINTSDDRFSNFNPTLFEANAQNSMKAKYDTAGESAIRMTACANLQFSDKNSDDYINGQLCGFFIGDGSAPIDVANSITFHLKRQRKVEYIKTLSEKLNLKLDINHENHTYRVKKDNIAKEFRKLFYTTEGEKTIPDCFFEKSPDFIAGVFDGLKNSDGSLKRKTWTYSTTSKILEEKLISLGACYGINFTPSYTISDKFKSGFLVRLNASDNEILVNDSRKPQERVSIQQSTETVYCATVPGNVLIVRRNGKIVLSGNCSPSEHQAMALTTEIEDDLFGSTKPSEYEWSGNFRGWTQYRKTLKNENITKFEGPLG